MIMSNHLQPAKWYFIVNPMAATGRVQKEWPLIKKKLQAASIDFEVVFTKHQGHAIQLAKVAIENGYRHLGVVGGDGTHHEVMNGIMLQQVVPTSEVTQALIPVGTGNDWIKTHQIPKDIDKAIVAIQQGKTNIQDIGQADFYKNGVPQTRYFLNVAGMAYDGYVSKKSNEQPNFASNKIFYFYLVLRCLFQYTTRKANVWFDGQTQENRFYTINVGICKYSGGGMQFVPQAEPSDGQFALSTVTHLPIPLVILSTPFMYGGLIKRHPSAMVTHATQIKVEATENEPTMLELDGEYLGETPVKFTLIEKAFRFIVP